MLRGAFLVLSLLSWSGTAWGGAVVDATGRGVTVPEQSARVLPAGPPAAIPLAVVAPDLMFGWPSSLSDEARSSLAPEAANLPRVSQLTRRDDVIDKIAALKPDLILDYGTVSPRYADLTKTTQRRTGIPTLVLDGSLSHIPDVLRLLGSILHREQRAEILARFSEALLALSQRPATLGLAWLGGGDPRTLATRFNAVVYGRALTTASEVDALIGGAHSMQPQRGYS
jgi:iron complex transport system substrate-binding protein